MKIHDDPCVICYEEVRGTGNNPCPVKNHGVCCNFCNLVHVVPARMLALGIKRPMLVPALTYCESKNGE